jgi:hypothetical protein
MLHCSIIYLYGTVLRLRIRDEFFLNPPISDPGYDTFFGEIILLNFLHNPFLSFDFL